jgi:transposase
MAGKKDQKKRFWLDDEKRSICAQTQASVVSVAQAARRYSMNANLIHKWLRDPRFAPEEETGEVLDVAEVEFVPVEIAAAVSVLFHSDIRVSAPAFTEPVSAQRVDITLSDGRRILVEGTTALSAVLALVEGLIAVPSNTRVWLADVQAKLFQLFGHSRPPIAAQTETRLLFDMCQYDLVDALPVAGRAVAISAKFVKLNIGAACNAFWGKRDGGIRKPYRWPEKFRMRNWGCHEGASCSARRRSASIQQCLAH